MVVSRVPHTPVVHGAGGGWRMVRDSDPRSMRSVVMPARLASGCLRPLGQPSKGIGYEKAHPRWDRLFRYSDYTRQRNTESGHGSSVAGISFVLGLGACQEFQNVPCPIGAVDVPRAGHFAARPPVLQVVAAHGDASVLPHPSGGVVLGSRDVHEPRAAQVLQPHALQVEPCAAFGAHRIPRGAGGVDRRAYRLVVVPPSCSGSWGIRRQDGARRRAWWRFRPFPIGGSGRRIGRRPCRVVRGRACGAAAGG